MLLSKTVLNLFAATRGVVTAASINDVCTVGYCTLGSGYVQFIV
jgi:hypothetical protein